MYKVQVLPAERSSSSNRKTVIGVNAMAHLGKLNEREAVNRTHAVCDSLQPQECLCFMNVFKLWDVDTLWVSLSPQHFGLKLISHVCDFSKRLPTGICYKNKKKKKKEYLGFSKMLQPTADLRWDSE